jgi:glycosyltransferase involved in cell wall biosynthesis
MLICNKKVAVCILTYNRKELLKESLESVFNSSSQDYEVFVFNDNSTDGTNEYLDSVKKIYPIIEIRNKVNLGQFGNANYVIENVNAKYCIFLHDDDKISSEHIKESLELAEKDSDIAVVGTFFNYVDENYNIVEVSKYDYIKESTILSDKEYFYHNLRGLTFTWSGSLIRMNKIKDLRFDFDYYHYFADSAFLVNLIAGNKVGFIPKPSVDYMITENRTTETKKMDFDIRFNSWIKIFKLYEDIINKNYDRDYLIELKKDSTQTLFSLLISICPNFHSFFKLIKSEYFVLSYLKFKDILRIFYKFFKILVGKK